MLLTKKYKKYEDMTREDFAEYITDVNSAIAHLATDIQVMEADLKMIQGKTKVVSYKLDKAIKGDK